MSFSVYPDRYLNFNAQSTKNISVVITIEGLGDTLSVVPIYTKIRYGDPGILYGTPGVVYGGLRIKENNKAYLMLDGLTISQRIEPESGKGSISLLNLTFIDKDGYLSKLISPGITLTEPMGRPLVRVYLGYLQTSFPDDYFTVFRGYISNTTSGSGWVTLQLSDANLKRYGQVFYIAMTRLTANIDSTTTTIPVAKTDGFFDQILGPDGTYDPAVKTYLKIDDEVMTYGPGGIVSPVSFSTLSRGGSNSRGTFNVAHTTNTAVANAVQIQDNAINIALKIMLSGWNGPYATGYTARAVGTSLDANISPSTTAILLSADIDAVKDLGLTVGDWVTVTGSSAGNDGTYPITDIVDQGGDSNRLLFTDHVFNYEAPAPGVALAFRSQFDTLPVGCGSKLTPKEVDVPTHIQVRDTYFSSSQNTMQLYFTEAVSAKDMIEAQCYLPLGIYSVSRYGQLSLGVTKPPIADQKLTTLSKATIKDPEKITVTRALNNRRFYNNVQYSFDLADNGVYQDTQAIIDTDSLTKVDINSVLPIASDGLKSAFGGDQVALSRGRFLLNRFKKGAFEIKLTVFWSVGSVIEVGDVVALKDEGDLKITNFATGERNLGTQLFEVIQRQMDIKNGSVQLTLLSQLAYNINQRFATVAPSSLTVAGSTTTVVRIKDSFGALYPGNEKKKWDRIIGNQIHIHSRDYTYSQQTTLVGFDPLDKYKMLVSPALSLAPPADTIVDVADYDNGTDPKFNQTTKLLYTFMTPSFPIVSASSSTQFDLSAPHAARMVEGQIIAVRNANYSDVPTGGAFSAEIKVSTVVGTTITLEGPLGFTPTAGQIVEYIGFKDGGGSYRVL